MSEGLPSAVGSFFAGGTRIAGYRLEEQIARGGMGVVFRALDDRLNRRVALKILAPELARDGEFRQRFLRELRAAATVDHPNIIPVFDAGEADGVLFIAMRFVDGGDVQALINQESELPAERVCDIVAQMASALDAAHGRGLVHRDVKPANMLCGGTIGNASPNHVYLSDFGLARSSWEVAGWTATAPTLSSIAPERAGLTTVGRFAGTPTYTAPEQIEGKPLDGRADQYSLACAAFEMLSGSPPFDPNEVASVVYSQLFEPPPSLTNRRPDLPSAVDLVFARALAKAPRHRYTGCQEFSRAMREALEPVRYHSEPATSIVRSASRSPNKAPTRGVSDTILAMATSGLAPPRLGESGGVIRKTNNSPSSAVAGAPSTNRRGRPGRHTQQPMRTRLGASGERITSARSGLWQVYRAIARWARGHLAAWIVGAAALDGALVALVTALITVSSQSSTAISGLVLALVVLLALSVVFPVAGHAVAEQDRRAQREQTRREGVDRLLLLTSPGTLPRLSELADDVLGVTPTRYTAGNGGPYVARRQADEAIRRLLSRQGPKYPFIVVWGSTKVGKSRTLVEALRAVFKGDTAVIVPRDGQALAELSRLGVEAMADRLPAVVVLDDLSPDGLEALTPSVLGHLREWAVIAATMTAQRRADVLQSGSKVGAIARAALATTSGEYELASGPPVGVEKAEAERLYPQECFEGSIAETLVGAQELIARYKASYDTHPAGCAVMRAAIDARRAGLSRPLSDVEIWRLFCLHLPAIRVDLQPTVDRFDEGIQWAAKPVTSQVALLRQASTDRKPRAWSVFDHAVTDDDGHGGHPARPMSAVIWAELIDAIPRDDAFAVGMAAHAADEDSAAVVAFRKAAISNLGDVAAIAANNLGILLDERGDTVGARAAYEQAIVSGQPEQAPKAAFNLGVLLEERGDLGGARAAYQQAIDSSHPHHAPKAAVNLGNLLHSRGDLEGARAAYQQAINSGHVEHSPGAAFNLGALLVSKGDRQGARVAYQLAVDSRHNVYAPMAAVNLGHVLAHQGDLDGARIAYHRAIDSGLAELVADAKRHLDDLG